MTEDSPRADWKLRLSLIGLAVVALTGLLVLWAGIVRHAMNDGALLPDSVKAIVISAAEFPGKAKNALAQIRGSLTQSPTALLIDKTSRPFDAQTKAFPNAADSGYLLFSGLASDTKRQEVRLIRISDGKSLAEWVPDPVLLSSQLTSQKQLPKGDPNALRFFHPLILRDASIIFNSTLGLIRIAQCTSKIQWVLDHVSHHSNELSESAASVWTASRNEQYLAFNPKVLNLFADDSLLEVSLEGEIIRNISFSEILEKNDLGALIFGTAGLRAQPDPIHINQISIAPNDSRHWKKGDLLISARNLSAVFLYRPSTGKVIWHKQGPWLNQHAARFVDDHRISVFDNHVYDIGPAKHVFLRANDVNRVFIYDFDDNSLSQPWAKLLEHAQVKTFTEGRAQVLPDGGLFVEETNHGRHLRFTKDALLWQRVNDFDEDHVAVVSWGRYLTEEEVQPVLDHLKAHPCRAV